MKLSLTTTPDALQLAGELDIYHIEAARDAVREFVGNNSGVVLDVAALSGCDATGLQLLLSVRRSAAEAGKSFVVRGDSAALRDCCRQLGVSPEAISLSSL